MSLSSSDMNITTKSEEYHTVTNSRTEQIAVNNLLKFLMKETVLSYDICNIIIAFLQHQPQFVTFNPIFYDGKYSLIEFVSLIINNIIHSIIFITLLMMSDINNGVWLFLGINILEILLIIYLYVSYYEIKPE
eukprot:86577_1